VKFEKPWVSSYFSDWRFSVTMVLPCQFNASGKIGNARYAGWTQRKAAQRSNKYKETWLHLQSALVLFWCGSNKTIRDCCWPWSILSHSPIPANFVRGKVAMKLNEHRCHRQQSYPCGQNWYQFFHVFDLSVVFTPCLFICYFHSLHFEVDFLTTELHPRLYIHLP